VSSFDTRTACSRALPASSLGSPVDSTSKFTPEYKAEVVRPLCMRVYRPLRRRGCGRVDFCPAFGAIRIRAR
jgi:hypothetical protein